MDIIFHYPPELFGLLVESIPALIRGKKDVILFFRGAGVKPSVIRDLEERLYEDKDSLGKHEIARTMLTRLNENGEASLRERREVLKRITEWEDFSTCWPNDRLKAQGLVAQIQKVVNVKDSFTKMKLEKEEQERKHREAEAEKSRKERERRAVLTKIGTDLSRLFGIANPQQRGKALESVLNRMFSAAGISITDAFTIRGSNGEGIVEQIDGAIAIEGNTYIVEMKWTTDPLGPDELSQHLVKMFLRGGSRAIFISTAGYTQPAITMCRGALRSSVVILCKLEEFVILLDKEIELTSFLKQKIDAAIVHTNPFFEPVTRISW
jgi:restriction system protein